MASGTVSAAIEDYLAAQWTATPLVFENRSKAVGGATMPPATPASFVEVSFSGRSYGQVSIGASQQADNRWDEEGLLMFDVLVPVNTGSRNGRTFAKQLADLFRGLTLLDGTLEFMDAALGTGGNSDRHNGSYYLLPVDIEWRRVEA